MQNWTALGLSVWEEKIFKDFFLCLYVQYTNPQHWAYNYPRTIILSNLVGYNKVKLHAKYESSRPHGLGGEEFHRFPSLSLCKIWEPTT